MCSNDPINGTDPLGLRNKPFGPYQIGKTLFIHIYDVEDASWFGLVGPKDEFIGTIAIDSTNGNVLSGQGILDRAGVDVKIPVSELIANLGGASSTVEALATYTKKTRQVDAGIEALQATTSELKGSVYGGVAAPILGTALQVGRGISQVGGDIASAGVARAGTSAEASAAKCGPDWIVSPHGKMPSPRPPGYQSHHGVNSVWADANIEGYVAEDATAILMKNNPYHNATRGVYNKMLGEIARRQGVSPRDVDWSKVSPGTAWRLAEEQLEAAHVPLPVREEFFRQFNRYLDTVR